MNYNAFSELYSNIAPEEWAAYTTATAVIQAAENCGKDILLDTVVAKLNDAATASMQNAAESACIEDVLTLINRVTDIRKEALDKLHAAAISLRESAEEKLKVANPPVFEQFEKIINP